MIVQDYKTWADFRAELAKLPPSASTGSGRSWSGNADSVGAALEIADKGWPEGAKRVQAIALPVVQAMSGQLEHEGLGFDVTGAAFDVGAHMTGVPECWLTLQTPDIRPAITIAANITSSGGIPARALEMRGAAVTALTMALQASGYAVQVHAIVGMGCTGESYKFAATDAETAWMRVCLTDDQGGPLDTDRLLFALAHPASPRQLMYANGERLLGHTVQPGNNLPWPKGGTEARPPAEWKADLYLHAVYVDDANWRDAESVSAWVRSQYETLTSGGNTQANEGEHV